MKTLKVWSLCASAALALGVAGCSDDDKTITNSSSQPAITDDISNACKGDACDIKQAEADAKMASCDFDAAFEAINAVYLGQVAENQVDPHTAFDRSVLGLVHLAYHDDVQKILPRLGFVADHGVVDFKPVWDNANGLFHQVFKTHDYDHIVDLLPLAYLNSEDVWLDTIDKSLTFDDVLDVLVKLKPDLESLAKSFAAAAATTAPMSPSSKIGCNLNDFRMDAADLELSSAFLYAAIAAIDWLAKYDFNVNVYDYIDINDEVEYSYLYDLKTCAVEFDELNRVVSDECLGKFNKDYTSLECYDVYSFDSYKDTYTCFLPSDSEAYRSRVRLVDLLDPHLFKKTQKSRPDTGLNGLVAFQNAASHLNRALNSNEIGRFFDFSAIPSDVVREMADIASKVAGTSVDLSHYIKPSLSIDLSKVFSNVLYRTEKLHLIPITDSWVVTSYRFDSLDVISNVIGDEIFLGKDWLNYITNSAQLFDVNQRIYAYRHADGSYSTSTSFHIKFLTNDTYDATFSSDWEDLDLEVWFNPHGYFSAR